MIAYTVEAMRGRNKTTCLIGCEVFVLLLSKAVKAISDDREHTCTSVGCYTRVLSFVLIRLFFAKF